MPAKKKKPKPKVAPRLGPPPPSILRGGPHADKRRPPRPEDEREALSREDVGDDPAE